MIQKEQRAAEIEWVLLSRGETLNSAVKPDQERKNENLKTLVDSYDKKRWKAHLDGVAANMGHSKPRN